MDLRKVHGEHTRAVERMIEAVDRHLPEETRVTRPQDAFIIWTELAQDVDTPS